MNIIATPLTDALKNMSKEETESAAYMARIAREKACHDIWMELLAKKISVLIMEVPGLLHKKTKL